MTSSAYHHGNLRKSLIDAALSHLKSEGSETLSLRALARKAGVSQTAPYRHFRDKTALLEELAAHSFNLLTERMLAASAPFGDDPARRIVAIGTSYVQFARDEPALFFLIFGPHSLHKNGNEALEKAGRRCFRVLLDTIEAGIDAGVLVDEPPIRMANGAWSTAHGLASLVVNGRDNPEQCGSLENETEATLALMVRGLMKPGQQLAPLR